MEIAILYNLLYYLSIAMCYLSGKTTQLLVYAIELPNYKLVRSDSDFEIRLYNKSSWMSASVRNASFTLSTQIGFHRLYQYMHGANLNSSKLAFTAPVLTSIASSPSLSRENNINYTVRFYISTKYQGKPPQPNPELALHLDKWNSHCVAVRKFSGFASDDDIDKEVEALVNTVNKRIIGNPPPIKDKASYSIAQYNGSHQLSESERLNEVWVSVSAPSVVGCPPYQ